MTRETIREILAEFLGTFILIVFGTAVVAQVVLSGQTSGTYLSINLGWALAVTMGVYVAGGISGAHLNPAVTLTLAIRRGFPWAKVLPYALAQLAGAFTGALVTFITYREALDHFDGGVRQIVGPQGTAGIFATYPQPFLSTFPGGFIDQVVGTALLLLLIFAISDAKNLAPDPKAAPVIVGLVVLLIGMTLQLRLRHQSRTRSGSTAVYCCCRLGGRRVSRRERLVVGSDCGTAGRRRARRLRVRPVRDVPASFRNAFERESMSWTCLS